MVKHTVYQVLRKSGLFPSKKKLVNALREGRVAIDGKVTKNQEFQLNPNSKKVTVDGEEISFVDLKYYILNKPYNTSCQMGDNFRYVRELIDKEKVGERVFNSLFSVGRLDIPTTGLLIITNDGNFSRKVLDPKFKVVKKYKVLLKKAISDEEISILEGGVKIELKQGAEYQCLPAKIDKVRDHEVYILISEGKFRQVRKMFEVVGNKVMNLQRVAIGNLELGDLDEGCWLEVGGEEVKGKIF